MKFAKEAASLLLLAGTLPGTDAYLAAPLQAAARRPTAAASSAAFVAPSIATRRRDVLYAKEMDEENDDDEEPGENPWADPNYPDLEFVDYSNSEYTVDQGIAGDEFFPSAGEQESISSALSDEEANAKIAEFREDRRRRNDEYQFETYHAEVLRSGELFRGEWEVYRTSTFLPGQEGRVDDNGMPALVKARRVLRMVSSGSKVKVETDSERSVDGERIVHEERMSTSSAVFDEADADAEADAAGDAKPEHLEFEAEIKSNRYWPEMLGPYDFRGEQGIQVVGNAYTICHAVPLGGNGKIADEDDASDDVDGDDGAAALTEGPFSELRTEVGIQYKRMRFRVKFDYRVRDSSHDVGTTTAALPPLSLRSMTVCREARERWPRYGPGRTDVDDAATAALFGPPGALGGLYDPPPVGSDEQAARYMMLDLEGGASVLFPHTIDQDPGAFGGNGWVTSLDWAPGRIRYQVDRKVPGGTGVKGLKTLELSEVQGEDVDWLRPRDGGADMRQ